MGARGKLGRRLAQQLPAVGTTIALGRDGVDLAQPDAIRETFARPAPT